MVGSRRRRCHCASCKAKRHNNLLKCTREYSAAIKGCPCHKIWNQFSKDCGRPTKPSKDYLAEIRILGNTNIPDDTNTPLFITTVTKGKQRCLQCVFHVVDRSAHCAVDFNPSEDKQDKPTIQQATEWEDKDPSLAWIGNDTWHKLFAVIYCDNHRRHQAMVICHKEFLCTCICKRTVIEIQYFSKWLAFI